MRPAIPPLVPRQNHGRRTVQQCVSQGQGRPFRVLDYVVQILRGGGVHGGRYRPGIQKDPIVLAVDVLEPDQKAKKYLVDHPRSVPIVLTRDTNLAAMYNAQVLSDSRGD
jgi:hypothetical protein